MRTSGRPRKTNLPTFSKKFQSEYRLDKLDSRNRYFTPRTLFLCILHLVGSSNTDGYWSALLNAFGGIVQMPTKSALCMCRQKISFHFFKDIFEHLLRTFEGERWLFFGYRIYAIDGAQWNLPRTQDILKHHYTGRAIGKYRATYTPKMYLTHCYDVLTGVTKAVEQSCYLDEPYDARKIIPGLEQKSITLYDKLYISAKMIDTHKLHKSYFIMRARSNFKVVENLLKSQEITVSRKIGKRMVTLFKVQNPKTGKWDVFVTNLKEKWVNPNTIQKLYTLRWEVEISFKDLSHTMKAEQWHSKSMNGILQEFYMLFWLMNWTKIQISKQRKPPTDPLYKVYWKPNFKVIWTKLKDLIGPLLKGKQGLLNDLHALIRITTERRIHYSREYPRVVKWPRSHYKFIGQVWEIPA
jgi:hypothetical protein